MQCEKPAACLCAKCGCGGLLLTVPLLSSLPVSSSVCAASPELRRQLTNSLRVKKAQMYVPREGKFALVLRRDFSTPRE